MIISTILILKKKSYIIVQRLWGDGRSHLARFLSTSSPSSEAWAGWGGHALRGGAKGEGGLGFKGFSAAQKMRTRNDSKKKKHLNVNASVLDY
jgi:hypothetical protein